MAPVQMMEIALRCVSVGWYIFPLGVKSKLPDGSLAPHGFKSASNDPEQIKTWWTASPDANIGIDLGRSNSCNPTRLPSMWVLGRICPGSP